MGAASRWWLHHSLHALDVSLGGNLHFMRGPAASCLIELTESGDVEGVFWNRCYEPTTIARDSGIKARLQSAGISVRSFNASLLFEPAAISKDDGAPYKVFTPYYKNGCLEKGPLPRDLIDSVKPDRFASVAKDFPLDELGLLPRTPWDEGLRFSWSPGEDGAKRRLSDFLTNGIGNYKEGRNYPALDAVSRLSPHLHFGELSPHQVWTAVDALEPDENTTHFRSELGWREFSAYLLYHWPEIPHNEWRRQFARFPWHDDSDGLHRWQRGMTGIPFVDAGMRELWRTGSMHNRVRMVAASFLVKNLRIDWRHGAQWFWDTLVDADLASNSASWQWVAGSGADAAPYFRIFNPVTQGKRFDAGGDYVRRYVPEIARLPDKFLHSPWEATDAILADAGIELGHTYPRPITDLKESRAAALQAYQSLAPAKSTDDLVY